MTTAEQAEYDALCLLWHATEPMTAEQTARMEELHTLTIPNVMSFSGGQTSGYMLHDEIRRCGSVEEYNRRFKTIFCNTGKEHDATLDFVHDVERKWGVAVTWLEYTRIPARDVDPLLVPEGRKRANLLKAAEADEGAHWFREVRWETAARRHEKHTPFDELLGWSKALPNVRGRSCSAFLKQRTMQRYLQAAEVVGYNAFIGIRHDEAHRALEILANCDDKNESPKFPLIEAKITKAHVDGFWGGHAFKLQIPNYMGNCDLCFLKARWKREAMARREPEAAQWWADWEAKFQAKGVTGDGALFRKGQSYAGLIAAASHPELGLRDEEDQDIPCSCAVGGYRAKEDEE
jgi:3'-phosphoadenosine 5'-phosphosulfate sulfotransferase (PAPS reductase)/FAD synthetase